jgi:hypothetical protein
LLKGRPVSTNVLSLLVHPTVDEDSQTPRLNVILRAGDLPRRAKKTDLHWQPPLRIVPLEASSAYHNRKQPKSNCMSWENATEDGLFALAGDLRYDGRSLILSAQVVKLGITFLLKPYG